MRNEEKWVPSKFIYRKGKLVGSRDPREVGIGSRLIVDCIADFYGRNLQKHAKGKLLDLGCGNVPLYLAYRDWVTDTTCVDWGGSWHKCQYLDHELDLTQPLPFKDGEFDTIILSDVLEHIPTPEQLWTEMSRVLSKNGKIIMNVPFYYWLHEQPHDYYRYTEFALRRFVDGCGLKLLQLDSMGGVPEVMTDMFAKTIMRVPKIGPLLARFAQWFTLGFIKTRFGYKISEATRDSFPLGYFMVAGK